MLLAKTPSGLQFGLVGDQEGGAAPLLIQLGGTITDSLTNPDFCRSSDLLVERGWRAVSVDLPVHGSEVREGEIEWDMGGWRKRLENGEDIMADISSRCSSVLDYLLESGIADPERIAVAGTSRGGFSALHFAAADKRPRWIGAIAPLTDMTVIREFVGAEYLAAARALSVHNLTEKLVGRSLWLCIGNDDRRVSTDSAIAFTRRLVEANKSHGLEADVELHVLNYDGHLSTNSDHDALAAWLNAKVSGQTTAGYGMLTLR